MRVSLDTNAWETIFAEPDKGCGALRDAFCDGGIRGFICEAAFRIEAIKKVDRASYFAQPHMECVVGDQIEFIDGRPYLKMSIGPKDARHPGVPDRQIVKLARAQKAGVKLMRTMNWLGLPCPTIIRDGNLYAAEPQGGRAECERRQNEVMNAITAKGVGRAAFEALKGWNLDGVDAVPEREFQKACAEWADAELVSAHIAYGNDVLCTNDCGRNAGRSIFDPEHRSWLAASYRVTFLTLDELTEVAGK